MIPTQPIRVAHFSDLHVTTHTLRMGVVDWFGKRAAGWFNATFGRGMHFRDAPKITKALSQELREQRCDLNVFTGDATVLGMAEEYDTVRELLRPTEIGPGIAVPGNHDHYTYQSVRRKVFEHTFGDWIQGDRLHAQTYPFARNVGGYWFVAVNSAVPNVVLFDSRGGVGRYQRRRVRELLKRLPPGPRILVTHYPLVLANGRSEKRWRRIRDFRRIRKIAAEGSVSLWLHGHRHSVYWRNGDQRRPFPVICAGSSTQAHRWSYFIYELDGLRLRATRRIWSPTEGRFEDYECFSLQLPPPKQMAE